MQEQTLWCYSIHPESSDRRLKKNCVCVQLRFIVLGSSRRNISEQWPEPHTWCTAPWWSEWTGQWEPGTALCIESETVWAVWVILAREEPSPPDQPLSCRSFLHTDRQTDIADHVRLDDDLCYSYYRAVYYKQSLWKCVTLVFSVLEFRQLGDEEEKVDSREERQTLGGDVDLKRRSKKFLEDAVNRLTLFLYFLNDHKITITTVLWTSDLMLLFKYQPWLCISINSV